MIGSLLAAVALAFSTSPAHATCPLTLPNGSQPPGDLQAGMNYGQGKLWTVFWPHNVVVAPSDYIQPDGSIAVKWPWWRGVAGELRIEGHRLDGEAPALWADSSSEGYGKRGFLPTTIHFPTEGCWEVTGSVGAARLTFVTLVLEASSYGLVEKPR